MEALISQIDREQQGQFLLDLANKVDEYAHRFISASQSAVEYTANGLKLDFFTIASND